MANRKNGKRRQPRHGHKPSGNQVVRLEHKVNKEKKIAFSGRDGEIPNLKVVNALNDVVAQLYWDYLQAYGKDSDPDMETLWKAFPGKQTQVTARLNDAMAALNSSLSQGVPTAILGGTTSAEWDLLEELFAEPSKFKAGRSDGKPWEPIATLIDYGEDRAEQAAGQPTVPTN